MLTYSPNKVYVYCTLKEIETPKQAEFEWHELMRLILFYNSSMFFFLWEKINTINSAYILSTYYYHIYI